MGDPYNSADGWPARAVVDPLFIFGDEKRCLHDLMADTIVVDV